MTQRLRVLVALAETPGLLPSLQMAAHTICNFSFRDPVPFPGLSEHEHEAQAGRICKHTGNVQIQK